LRRLDLRKTQAARLNTIRDINRQIVLNYVREREPISRAEIARETNLQRSTISAIVEALTAEGLVEEVGEGESTGGRRPTLLRLRTKEAIAIGVAITPTCTTVATSDLAGRIIEQNEFPTDPDPDKTLKNVVTLVGEFSAKNTGSIEAVGVALPGLVDPSTGSAVYVSKSSADNIVVRQLLGGNEIGVLFAFNSGLPANIVSSRDLNGDGIANNDRPLGVSRNSLYMPVRKNVDLRYTRWVPIHGSVRAEIIAELKNVFNIHQLQTVNTVIVTDALGNPTVSIPTDPYQFVNPSSASFEQRKFQLGFRVRF